MGFALFPERLRVGVETPVQADQVDVTLAEMRLHPFGQTPGIRGFFRTETGIASTPISWAESAASGVCYRSHARGSMRDHHTNLGHAFALHADTVRGGIRFAAVKKGAQDFHQLRLADGA